MQLSQIILEEVEDSFQASLKRREMEICPGIKIVTVLKEKYNLWHLIETVTAGVPRHMRWICKQGVKS